MNCQGSHGHGHGQQACEDPGYTADVSSSNCSSKLSRSTNRDEFDSTTSWFLENVDSYCLEENTAHNSQNMVKSFDIEEDVMPQFDSTGSWFLDNVNEFQKKNSKCESRWRCAYLEFFCT